MKPLVLLLRDSLAVWRLSHMLVHEEGPGDLLVKLRESTGVHDGGQLVTNTWTPLWCVWCTSLWVAFVLPLLPTYLRTALAASAIAMIVDGQYGSR